MTHLYTSKQELSERIDRELRARIADGRWPPGHPFTWPELVEEFSLVWWDVSRVLSPILGRMRDEGLIEARPYLGSRVTVPGESWNPPPEYAGLPHDVYIEIVIRQRLHDGLGSEGLYRPGKRFPSLVELAEEFGVSCGTVRKATTPLRKQGILVLVNTNRTYVSADLAKMPTDELLMAPVRRKSGTAKLEAFGESRTLSEWSRHPRCCIDYQTLHTRWVQGWSLEEALTRPKVFSRVHAKKPSNVAAYPPQDAYTVARNFILARLANETYSAGTVIPVTDVSVCSGVSEAQVVEALEDLRDLEMVKFHSGLGYAAAAIELPAAGPPPCPP